jgi:uncharacterized repeat protein (TIGR03803 family)
MVYVAQANKLYGTTTGGGANGMGVLFSYNPEADNYVALYSFDAQSGNKPSGPLIYVADNHKLYGMMNEGGTAEAPNVASGTIFSYDVISETFEVLYTFGADDNVQYNPVGSLAYQQSQGMLYGATSKGGTTDQGVLFSFDISGSTYTKILSFGADTTGIEPLGSLTLWSDGALYGVTAAGGTGDNGVIFKLQDGQYTELYNMNSIFPIGKPTGPLTYGIDAGTPFLYGLAAESDGSGTLYSFNFSDSEVKPASTFPPRTLPTGTLVFDGLHTLYGVAKGTPQLFAYDSETRTISTVYDFAASVIENDGTPPVDAPVFALNDHTLYGVASGGGDNGFGIIYRFVIPDVYPDEINFDPVSDAPINQRIESAPQVVTGIGDGYFAPITITSCSAIACSYFVDAVENTGSISNNQALVLTVQLDTCESSAAVRVNVGGKTATFTATGQSCSSGGGSEDTTPPEAFISMPATSTSLTVPITISGTDNVAVTGYHVSELLASPRPSDCEPAPPLSQYTFGSYGTHTLYVWACDASSNVSNPASATITITAPVAPPDPTPPPSNNNTPPRSSSVRVDTTGSTSEPTTPTAPAIPVVPAPVDADTPLIKKITQAPVTVLDSPIKQAIKRNFTPAQVAVIEVSLKAIVAIVTTIGGAIVLASVLFLNPLARPEFILIPLRLWSMLLVLLGIRKKPIPWGTVYDSITKQPLDPVRVSLVDIDGNVVETSITDTSGRYGFAAKPGVYKVVLSKTNYLFPSHVIAQNDMRDELYDKPYFGDYLPYDPAAPITKNIPLDPLDFDTALFAQKQGDLSIHYSKREAIADRVFTTMLLTTFLIVAASVIVYPEPYNIVVLALYLVSFVFRRQQKRLKHMGRIYDLYGKPLGGVLIKVYSAVDQSLVKTIKTTRGGRYYLRVPKGLYRLRIERKTTDGLMVPVYESPELLIQNGFLNKVFNIAYS